MKISPVFLSIVLAVLLSSCAGPRFHKQWEAALNDPSEPGSIAGAWEGSWLSEKNGHTGKLKAIVDETGENTYKFLYWATWGPGMRGTFQIDCEGEEKGGVTTVRGKKKLGPFGTYQHAAEITETDFDATFSSEKENLGTFELIRP
tara:strand:- start:14715 stop:15152 length:438 start_codon:yes stop_codon:yes gene_type:complete